MGDIRQASHAKLIVGILLSNEVDGGEVCTALEHAYGTIDSESVHIPFTYTDYYALEMGAALERFWVSFEKLIPQDTLSLVKRTSNKIEVEFAGADSMRRVNIDPGYIIASRLVLATTKNYAHRIYIGEGIYAEVTLVYSNKAFQSFPWTYPDYKDAPAQEYFRTVRTHYLQQLHDTEA